MQKKTTAPWPSRQPGRSGPGLTEKAGGKGEKVRQELTRRLVTVVLCTSEDESPRIPASEGGPSECRGRHAPEGRTIEVGGDVHRR